LSGEAIVVEHLGAETHVLLTASTGENVTAVVEGRSRIKVGDRVSIATPTSRVHLFDAQGIAIESSYRLSSHH
jgi:ABC-type sugar transport system ATPase subunit